MLGLVLSIAGPASATTLPKIQTDGFGNWNGTWSVRPSLVGFGMHFFIKDLHFSHYNQRSAYARGRLLLDTCRPDCAQAVTT